MIDRLMKWIKGRWGTGEFALDNNSDIPPNTYEKTKNENRKESRRKIDEKTKQEIPGMDEELEYMMSMECEMERIRRMREENLRLSGLKRVENLEKKKKGGCAMKDKKNKKKMKKGKKGY